MQLANKWHRGARRASARRFKNRCFSTSCGHSMNKYQTEWHVSLITIILPSRCFHILIQWSTQGPKSPMSWNLKDEHLCLLIDFNSSFREDDFGPSDVRCTLGNLRLQGGRGHSLALSWSWWQRVFCQNTTNVCKLNMAWALWNDH